MFIFACSLGCFSCLILAKFSPIFLPSCALLLLLCSLPFVLSRCFSPFSLLCLSCIFCGALSSLFFVFTFLCLFILPIFVLCPLWCLPVLCLLFFSLFFLFLSLSLFMIPFYLRSVLSRFVLIFVFAENVLK